MAQKVSETNAKKWKAIFNYCGLDCGFDILHEVQPTHFHKDFSLVEFTTSKDRDHAIKMVSEKAKFVGDGRNPDVPSVRIKLVPRIIFEKTRWGFTIMALTSEMECVPIMAMGRFVVSEEGEIDKLNLALRKNFVKKLHLHKASEVDEKLIFDLINEVNNLDN